MPLGEPIPVLWSRFKAWHLVCGGCPRRLGAWLRLPWTLRTWTKLTLGPLHSVSTCCPNYFLHMTASGKRDSPSLRWWGLGTGWDYMGRCSRQDKPGLDHCTGQRGWVGRATRVFLHLCPLGPPMWLSLHLAPRSNFLLLKSPTCLSRASVSRLYHPQEQQTQPLCYTSLSQLGSLGTGEALFA